MNEGVPKPRKISPEQSPIADAPLMEEETSLEATPDEVVAEIRETLKESEGAVSEKQADMIIEVLKETEKETGGVIQTLANLPKSVRRTLLATIGALSLLAASPQWSEGAEKKGTKTHTEEAQKSQQTPPQSAVQGFNSAVEAFGTGQLQRLDKSVTEMSQKVNEAVSGVQESVDAKIERLKQEEKALYKELGETQKKEPSNFKKSGELRDRWGVVNEQLKRLQGGGDKDLEMLNKAREEMKKIDLENLRKK